MKMGPKTIELMQLLEKIILQMRAVREQVWSEKLDLCLRAIKNGDFSGVERFLGCFGGMGSLNDLVIHPMNGHSISLEKVKSVNSSLSSDIHQASSLARQIKAEQ